MMRLPVKSADKKRCRQVVKPAANFNIYDGVNLMCFASNRKSHAVAICNLRRFRDGPTCTPNPFALTTLHA
jgi:hypothetical protein